MIPRMAVVMLLAIVTATSASAEQGPSTGRRFEARLSVVPIDLTMQKTIAGSGRATASLDDHTLTIEGAFAGLVTPATVARVHRGEVMGLRGPAIADLQVGLSTAGKLRGAVTLTDAELDDLARGRLYIQLHSERAPEGNLWGWLLEPKSRK